MKQYIFSKCQSRGHSRLKEAGFSLIEMLIVVGLLGIVTVGLMTLITNAVSDMKGVSEKLASIDLQKSLVTAITAGKNLCGFAVTAAPASFSFASATFPPASIAISGLYMDAAGADPLVVAGTNFSNSTLRIVSLAFSNIALSTTDRYTANLTVVVASSRPVRPLVTRIMLNTVNGGATISLAGCTTIVAGGVPTTQAECEAAGLLWVAAGNFCYSPSAGGIDWY